MPGVLEPGRPVSNVSLLPSPTGVPWST